jgi:hypothetical protein
LIRTTSKIINIKTCIVHSTNVAPARWRCANGKLEALPF